MDINISQLNLYLECPTKWHNVYVAKRGLPITEGGALDLGIQWHKLVAGQMAMPNDAPPWMVGGYSEWLSWLDEHPHQILAQEVILRHPLGSHTLLGRPDTIIVWNDRLWHLQHKTSAPGVSVKVFAHVQARSFHEHGYRYLITETYKDIPYGGTILAICRKKPKNPPFFHVEWLAPNNADYIACLSNIETIAEAMETNTMLIQNRNSCGGYFHNKLCDYLDVCNGFRSLDEFPAIDPLKDYHVTL